MRLNGEICIRFSSLTRSMASGFAWDLLKTKFSRKLSSDNRDYLITSLVHVRRVNHSQLEHLQPARLITCCANRHWKSNVPNDKLQDAIRNKVHRMRKSKKERSSKPSVLLKTENGRSISTKFSPFFRQASSAREVASTITTGVISSGNSLTRKVFAGSIVLSEDSDITPCY